MREPRLDEINRQGHLTCRTDPQSERSAISLFRQKQPSSISGKPLWSKAFEQFLDGTNAAPGIPLPGKFSNRRNGKMSVFGTGFRDLVLDFAPLPQIAAGQRLAVDAAQHED